MVSDDDKMMELYNEIESTFPVRIIELCIISIEIKDQQKNNNKKTWECRKEGTEYALSDTSTLN